MDVSEREEYRIECPFCRRRTVAIRMTSMRLIYADEAAYPNWFNLAECRICNTIHAIRSPKTVDNHFSAADAEVISSSRSHGISSRIPESLRREHSEAWACFSSESYTATVVMVRRTLEGVCAEHGIKARVLFKALEQLAADGLIEGRLLDWAQELRLLGNEGAHFTGDVVSREDAQDALALAEALLEYLYVYSAQFKEFRDRRTRRMAVTPVQDGDSPDETTVKN